MRVLSDRLRRRIEAEETRRILRELQIQEEANYPFLSRPSGFFWRYRAWLEQSGEIIFAAVIAALALVLNYVVFVRLLHIQF